MVISFLIGIQVAIGEFDTVNVYRYFENGPTKEIEIHSQEPQEEECAFFGRCKWIGKHKRGNVDVVFFVQ